jgi:predicted nucleotidyltransferase
MKRRLPSEIVDEKRCEILEIAAASGLSNVRVFGSVARGEDTVTSDIDLLVTPGPKTSLLDISGFLLEVKDLTGCDVSVVSDRAVPEDSEILREARTL